MIGNESWKFPNKKACMCMESSSMYVMESEYIASAPEQQRNKKKLHSLIEWFGADTQSASNNTHT